MKFLKIVAALFAVSLLASKADAVAGGPDFGYTERGSYTHPGQELKYTMSGSGTGSSTPIEGSASINTAVAGVIPYGAKYAIISAGAIGQADGGWALTATDTGCVTLSDTMSGSAGEADAWGLRGCLPVRLDKPVILRDLDVPPTGVTVYVWYPTLPKKWFAIHSGAYSIETY